MKYFIIFAFLLFILLGYKTYEQYNRIDDTHKLIIENESQSLAEFISAFRQTYQDAFLDHHIEVNDKTINLLPVKTITEISDRFASRVQGDVVIRTVSDRPRNANNMANDFELGMINYFKDNPKETHQFIQKENAYYYTKPIYIKQACLKCHGKREDAIPSVRENYENAYDYKLGDLRGLLNIKIKEQGFFAVLYSDFVDTLAITILLYMLFLIIIYILIRKMRREEQKYTKKLEVEIAEKTSEIEKQKNTFETLFEKSSDGILIINNSNFVQCNEKIVEMLLCNSKEEVLNMHPSDFSPEFQPDGRASDEKAEEMIQLAIDNDGNQFEWMHQRSNGENFWSEISLTPITLNDRKVIYVVWRDISEKKMAQKKLMEQKDILYYQAHHDPLTGLPNRMLFNERLETGIEKAKQKGTKLALFFIDLDQFKQINDSLGHEIGDRVLYAVAERIKAKVRKKDTLARLGGDEFVIIMEEYKKIEDISRIAEKILKVLIQPIHVEGQTLYTSCSIGISLYPKDDTNIDHLLKYADAAMYKAKDEGRNNFQFYRTEMTELAYERIIMKAGLRQALENKEFKVYYQPQIDANSEKLIGLEALVRWEHPNMGLIPPAKFIPLAEENGLIVEIDQWVMRTAMKQITKWYKEGLTPGVLALNLSLSHLRRDDYIHLLKECIEKNNFESSWLELEITEGEVMKKFEEVITKLQAVSDMNISISIDDFGTGHSSLSYLKKLPVNKLKIDQSFIKDIPEDEEDVAIVKTIISLAKNLKLDVIAEGVETAAQKEFLIENGCTQIQGYYYGEPMPAKEIKEKYLKKS
jgi:diguanylate cyclase (GGDEF)-like protein/PAS domain S-box-containing protein